MLNYGGRFLVVVIFYFCMCTCVKKLYLYFYVYKDNYLKMIVDVARVENFFKEE